MKLQTGGSDRPWRRDDRPWRRHTALRRRAHPAAGPLSSRVRKRVPFDAGRIQLQGPIRVPDRVVDFLDVAWRECVAVIRSFLIEWRLNVHLGLIFGKRCFKNRHLFGNARKAATRFEALPRKCSRNRHSMGGNAAWARRSARYVRKAATCLQVLSLASRGRCTPLATLSLERYAVPWRVRNRGAQPMAHHAVPWRVRNHGAVVACEITTHSSWCRPMKKGASQYDPHPY